MPESGSWQSLVDLIDLLDLIDRAECKYKAEVEAALNPILMNFRFYRYPWSKALHRWIRSASEVGFLKNT